MSALLASASATFSYQGANVTLSCGSPEELKNALATFGIGAANDAVAPGKSKPAAATAPAGPSASPPAAPSAPPAAAAGADAGNASASTATQASAQPAAAGSAASAGEAGNGAAASASPATGAASTASSSEPSGSPAVSFDELKKAFLALSTKPGGREKCEAVLKPFGLPKLSAANADQYAAILAEIKRQAGE
jgi:hypothetical protein